MFSNFRQCYQVMKDHTKIVKMLFWMIQKSKNEVFGYFLEFGLVDRLDIAYCERTKCFPTFGNVTRSQRIIQISQKCIFNDPKAQAYHTQLHLSFDGSKHFWMMIQSAKKRFSQIGSVVLTANSKQKTANSKQQAANSKQQTLNCKQQTSNIKRQVANCKLQTANSKQQTANRKRQTENGKQETANRKQQTANSKQQTALDWSWAYAIGMLQFSTSVEGRVLIPG